MVDDGLDEHVVRHPDDLQIGHREVMALKANLRIVPNKTAYGRRICGMISAGEEIVDRGGPGS